jgi:hypothetical protein
MSSTTTPTYNICDVDNGLTLPFSPTIAAQTGWNGSISVINAYELTNTASQFFQQSLALLNFSNQTTSLAIGQTGELQLPYLQPGSTTQENYNFNLLVVQSNNYFPVSSVGEEMNAIKQTFPEVTVPQPAPANSSTAANAYTFYQMMMAYPSSPLAQGYTTALNSAGAATTSTQLDSTMASFFAGTSEYQNVNFPTYLMVQSYAQAFAYPWANFQTSYTYYFYGDSASAASNNSASGNTDTTDQKVTLLGTMTLVAQGALPAPLAAANSGYTITYTPASGDAIPLNFVNGQFVPSDSNSLVEICLQATFVDLSQMTGISSDYGTPIPAMVGTIPAETGSTTGIGSNIQQTESKKAKTKADLGKVTHSIAFEVLQIAIPLCMGIKLTGEFVGWVAGKFKSTGGSGATDAEKAEKQDELEDEGNDQLEAAGSEETVPTGDDLTKAQEDAQADADNSELEGVETEEIDEQSEDISAQDQMGVGEEQDVEFDDMEDEIGTLETIEPTEVDANQELVENQSTIDATDQTIATTDQAQAAEESGAAQQSSEQAADNVTDEEDEEDDEFDDKEDDEKDDEDGDDAEDALDDV